MMVEVLASAAVDLWMRGSVAMARESLLSVISFLPSHSPPPSSFAITVTSDSATLLSGAKGANTLTMSSDYLPLNKEAMEIESWRRKNIRHVQSLLVISSIGFFVHDALFGEARNNSLRGSRTNTHKERGVL